MSLPLLLLLFQVFSSIAVQWCDEPPPMVNPKIIGGDLLSKGDFSFQVAVVSLQGNGYGMLCGGTVVDEYRVLTAAHCTGQKTDKLYVLMGLSSLSNPEYTLQVTRFFRHPGFNEVTIADDIAILEVKHSLFNRGATPICLSRHDAALVSGHLPGQVAGFGLHIVNNTSYGLQTTVLLAKSDQLLSVDVPIIPMSQCSPDWRRLSLGAVRLTDKQLCAGDVLKGTSSGDSGGPLLVRDKLGRLIQVGITSFGASGVVGMLNQRQYPGVYTRVSAYADWIDLVTSPSSSPLSLSLILIATKLYF